MYKKIFLIIFICISLILLDNSEENTLLVGQDISEVEEYYVFSLEIDNLNTKNFLHYFSDEYRILKIYPFVNSIYDHDKEIMREYSFLNKSIKYNINYFESLYLNSIDKYFNEKEKYFINGIPILKVTVYASNFMIDDLLNSHSNIKVKLIN